jgi:polysaccharide deacetylase family protein (PEP-CTERM system associated)
MRFREDLRRSREILEGITGKFMQGYRAPSYSITARSLWALDILIEEGFAYDSSIFPVRHDIYGVPGAERFPHVIRREAGEMWEFPLTTWPIKILGKQCCVPVAGGGYLRLLPAGLISRVFRQINERDRRPAVLYFHPWELDPDQPRMKACLKSRFRHYLNLHRTGDKLRSLLSGLRFGTMGEALEGMKDLERMIPQAAKGGKVERHAHPLG